MSLENKVNETMKSMKITEKVFVYSDIHYPEHNEKALNVATKVMSDYKPTKLVLIGDALDMTPVSHWIEDKKRLVENKRLMQDYKGFNKVLDHMVKVAGKQLKEVIYLKGNHEEWVDQYLDRHPELTGLLEVENNIKLIGHKGKRTPKLKFIQYNDFYKVGKLYLTHGLYANKYHSFKTVDNVGATVMYGHTHDVQVFTKAGLAKGLDKHMGISIGCLCDMSPRYMRKKPNNWMHAFATVEVFSNGNFIPAVHNIVEGVTTYNGKLYKG